MSAQEHNLEKTSIGFLESMHLLESKVSTLIAIIKHEKAYSAQLLDEKNALESKLAALENSLLKESRSIVELNQEREMTKLVVEELIASIDTLVLSLPEAQGDSRQLKADNA